MNKKIVAIIQGRMGSTRLPGKIMKDLFGKTVLEHVIERVEQSKFVDEIVIATTTLDRDNIIVEESEKYGVTYFRGSEEDVLSRYYNAAKENKANIVIRITSDCPLIDPFVIDEIVEFYLNNEYDIISNAGADLVSRTYPRGLDTEVFSFNMLEKAFNNANEKYQREHVTPYIYEDASSVYYYNNNTDYSKLRWTLDTEEDLELITKIYEKLYKGEHNFYLKDIVNLIEKYPELLYINNHIEQKKIKC